MRTLILFILLSITVYSARLANDTTVSTNVTREDLVHDYYKQAEAVNKQLTDAAKVEIGSNMAEVDGIQHTMRAEDAFTRLMNEYDIVRNDLVPQAQQAAINARIGAAKSQQASKTATSEVLKEVKSIPQQVADQAAELILKRIQEHADKTARETAKKLHDNFDFNLLKAKQATIASAVQPYHIAQLRAQKASAEFHKKAMDAMKGAQDLSTEANKIATQAQGFQSSGLTTEAANLMMTAHNMMNDAASLKANAEGMYAEANRLHQQVVGSYGAQAAMAAGRASATLIFDRPMELPEG